MFLTYVKREWKFKMIPSNPEMIKQNQGIEAKPMINPNMLNAPIPGMSLTTEPGNRPWENPPQLTTLEEAVSFYSEKLLDEEKFDAIGTALVTGVPVEIMADHLTTSAVMDGIHTIDISMLVNPVVQELIKYVADANGFEYIESLEEEQKKKKLPRAEVLKIVREVTKNQNQMMEQPMQEEEPQIEKPKGLMARNKKQKATGE